jgi:hypothetical protein
MNATDTGLHAGIEARTFEGGAILGLSGTVDFSGAVRLHEVALRRASGGGAAIPDRAECRCPDAAAWQTLLALKRRLEAGGGSLRVGRDSPAARAWPAMARALPPAPDERQQPAGARRS